MASTGGGGSGGSISEGGAGAELSTREFWSHRYGDDLAQDIRGVAVDASGNVLVTGAFQGTIDFGKGPMSTPPSDATATDVFVAKLDPFGNALWSKRFGDEGWQSGEVIAVDVNGAVIVAGLLVDGTADFGGGALPADGEGDLFGLG